MRISVLNRTPVDVAPGRGGGGVQLGDGVDPAEVVEHVAPPPGGPAERVGAAEPNRELCVEQRVLGTEPDGNLLAARERELDGARGRSGKAGRLGALPPRRCAGRRRRSAYRPGVPDLAAGAGGRGPGVEGDRVRLAAHPRRSNAPRVGGGGWRPGARPDAPRSRRGREWRRVRCAPDRPEMSFNPLCYVKLRWDGGRSGARRGRLTAPAHQLQRRRLVEPLRVDSPRIRIVQSALDVLLQGEELLDVRRVAASLVVRPVPVNQYIDGQ